MPRRRRRRRPGTATRGIDSSENGQKDEAIAAHAACPIRRWHPARAPTRSTLSRQARLRPHPGAEGSARPQGSCAVVRRAEALGVAAALRLSPRMERRADQLGGTEGHGLRPQGKADGGACRGPPRLVRQLRRDDSGPAVRRRNGDRLGPRHVGAGRRRRRGPEARQARLQAARREARGALGTGSHRQAGRQAGPVDAVQEARRVGSAAGRVRRTRRIARQRHCKAARPCRDARTANCCGLRRPARCRLGSCRRPAAFRQADRRCRTARRDTRRAAGATRAATGDACQGGARVRPLDLRTQASTATESWRASRPAAPV